MTDEEVVKFIDSVKADDSLNSFEKYDKIVSELKTDKENPLIGLHFSVKPDTDAEQQQIMNETIDVLRSFYAGECEDVTEKVLNGEEF